VFVDGYASLLSRQRGIALYNATRLKGVSIEAAKVTLAAKQRLRLKADGACEQIDRRQMCSTVFIARMNGGASVGGTEERAFR